VVHDVAAADFNGDEYPDIVLVSHSGPGKIYFNSGDGSFSEGPQNIGASNDNPQYIDLGDVDSDEDIDLFIYNSGAANRLWLNDGSGTFTMVNIDYGGSNAKGFELADLNGDSFLDLFINMRELPNEIWFNDGSGTFVNSGITLGNEGEKCVAADYDHDEDMDILISSNAGVTAWLNQDNTGSFTSTQLISEATYLFALIDVELDDDYDIISTNFTTGNKLWRNDGSGNFTSLGQVFGSNEIHSIGCADLDADNDLDVVFGQVEGTGGNSIYFNESTIAGIEHRTFEKSTNIKLKNCFPNPFSHTTKIEFSVTKSSNISLRIVDAKGNEIQTIVDDYLPAGDYSFTWDGRNSRNEKVSTGVYYCQLSDRYVTEAKRVVYLHD